MDPQNPEYVELRGLSSLKTLLAPVEGQCLSVYLPLSGARAQQDEKTHDLQWCALLDEAADENIRKALGSWEDVRAVLPPARIKAVAVLRSSGVFAVIGLHHDANARIVTGPQFFIRPLLKEVTAASAFYLLALSLKDIRLLRCTLDTSEEVPLGEQTKTSFETFMASAKTDHTRIRSSVAGAGAGSSKGAVGTTTTEREAKDEYLGHYFKHLDGAITETLRGHDEPLVIAGVRDEVALYRRSNSYPHLATDFVKGAPNSLKSGEMHARALTVLESEYSSKIDAVLAEYDHKAGGAASNRLKDIVTAAHDGRVTTLLISETTENFGSFDEATNEASGRGSGEIDLINDAAIETVLHSGAILTAPNNRMLQGAPAVAIFRY